MNTIITKICKSGWLDKGALGADCGHPLGCIEIASDGPHCQVCDLQTTLRLERRRFHRAIAKMTNYCADLEVHIARMEAERRSDDTQNT